MKQIVKIVSWSSKNELYFKEKAEEIGWLNIDFLSYFDIYYHDWFRYIKTQEKIKEYDIYWISWKKWEIMKNWLYYQLWFFDKKTIIDKRKELNLFSDKFSQLLFCKNNWFNIANSIFFIINEENINNYIDILEKNFTYPFIAKYPSIDRWEWVFLIKNICDLNNILKNKDSSSWIIFQEFIKNKWDYRIIVIWNKVIWTIKRYNPNDHRNNVSIWWEVISIKIDEKIKSKAIEISKAFWQDISWIDFFIKEDWDYSFIEINSQPQFSWFEKATWVSYPLEVLKYLKEIKN